VLATVWAFFSQTIPVALMVTRLQCCVLQILAPFYWLTKELLLKIGRAIREMGKSTGKFYLNWSSLLCCRAFARMPFSPEGLKFPLGQKWETDSFLSLSAKLKQ
jgi:hypothetical protein